MSCRCCSGVCGEESARDDDNNQLEKITFNVERRQIAREEEMEGKNVKRNKMFVKTDAPPVPGYQLRSGFSGEECSLLVNRKLATTMTISNEHSFSPLCLTICRRREIRERQTNFRRNALHTFARQGGKVLSGGPTETNR